jgi:hypothetical protein
VNVGTHVVLVETDRVLLDGRERGKLSPSADLVQISNVGNRLTVTAGRTEVFSETLGGR